MLHDIVWALMVVGVLIGWTVVYHYHIVLHKWRRGVAIGVMVILAASVPLAGFTYQQDRAAKQDAAALLALQQATVVTTQAAREAFQLQYPDRTLTSSYRVDDAWIYIYTDGTANHAVVRLNKDWLPVAIDGQP
jgi:hypothetical protein